MKKIPLFSMLIIFFVGSLCNAEGPGPASASIHRLNMGSDLSATSDLCVFCHTPIGNKQFNMNQLGWKKMPENRGGQFPAISLSSDLLGQSVSGSISVVCLSCHDGAQAPDVSVPGSNGIVGATSQASDGSQFGLIASPVHRPGARYANSHPVGVPYAGQKPEAIDPTLEIDFAQRRQQTFHRAEKSVVNEIPVWWLETGAPGRQKNDIQLYTRMGNDNREPIPFVECSSCHDPHSSNRLLLRLQDENRRLCIGCHSM